MSYATQAQIVIACGGQVAFDQLFDYDGDQVADVDVIAQAQTAADALINSYLRFVTNPSLVLQMLAADEAIYCARKYRPALGATEDDHAQHKARREMLADMRDGKIRPDEPVVVASSDAGSKAIFVENCSPMSRANSKGSIW
jgi:phage gp36-like protein